MCINYAACRNKKKEMKEKAAEANSETALFQRDELEINLEEKSAELQCLEEKVAAMQDAHKKMAEEARRTQEELARARHEAAKTAEANERLEAEAAKAKQEAESAHAAKVAALENDSSQPVIDDLGRQLREARDECAELEVQKANLKELLDEAGEDYTEKLEEAEALAQKLKEADKQVGINV